MLAVICWRLIGIASFGCSIHLGIDDRAPWAANDGQRRQAEAT
jgi:hypothetical protein